MWKWVESCENIILEKMAEDKTMRAQDHILEKIRSEGVMFSCYYYIIIIIII